MHVSDVLIREFSELFSRDKFLLSKCKLHVKSFYRRNKYSEILPPLFSTVEAGGVTRTWYVVEILNKLLHLSTSVSSSGKWGNGNRSYHAVTK